MNGRVSKTGITCLGFFALLSIHHIYRSSISDSFAANGSPKGTGKCWKLKKPKTSTRVLTHNHDPIICDRSHYRYDVCSLNGPTLMDPKTSTFIARGPRPSPTKTKTQTQTIRPYPRKWEKETMSNIKELTLSITSRPTPPCRLPHNAPALVFSAGGFTGNFFHEFADGLVPLFITIRLLFDEQQNPPVLVITNCHHWWISKYTHILRHFTPHPIINLDNETATHCFPSAHFGLVSHGFMSVDPALMPHSESLLDFHSFLHRSYSGGLRFIHQDNASANTRRPLFVLASRNSGDRMIKNRDDVVQIAEEVGFNVVIFEPNQSTMLRTSYAMINASHVLLGVHGAALTHLFFLRPGAVFIQVVPIGIDWLAETCFGEPARKLGLEYMEYKIGIEESSLGEKYGKEDMVLKDPKAFLNKSFAQTKQIYLKSQDVRLDVVRVRSLLEVAYEKADRLMEKKGYK